MNRTKGKRAFVSGILLAAGRSTRFGRTKQLAELAGEALVERALRELMASGLDEVVVVLGNDAERARRRLEGKGAKLVENPGYAAGISSSLRLGLASLDPRSDAVIVALSDQPFVSSALVEKIVGSFRSSGAAAVAAASGDLVSPPVLLSRALYPKVAALTGDRGAKSVVVDEPGLVKVEVRPEVLLDVDTEEDLLRADRHLRKTAREADTSSRGRLSSGRSSPRRPRDSRHSG